MFPFHFNRNCFRRLVDLFGWILSSCDLSLTHVEHDCAIVIGSGFQKELDTWAENLTC